MSTITYILWRKKKNTMRTPHSKAGLNSGVVLFLSGINHVLKPMGRGTY